MLFTADFVVFLVVVLFCCFFLFCFVFFFCCFLVMDLCRNGCRDIVLYSRFIWLNGSMSLIRAETERCDIQVVGFSKVTTKSLVSETGS